MGQDIHQRRINTFNWSCWLVRNSPRERERAGGGGFVISFVAWPFLSPFHISCVPFSFALLPYIYIFNCISKNRKKRKRKLSMQHPLKQRPLVLWLGSPSSSFQFFSTIRLNYSWFFLLVWSMNSGKSQSPKRYDVHTLILIKALESTLISAKCS